MFEDEKSNAMTAASARGLGMVVRPTTRQRLEESLNQIEDARNKVLAALRALDENPQLEQFLETLHNAGV